ncbi:hypothetical protein [Arthrobacter sp. efr-133-TYG-118]|uniref:hypothetical protein n=1 Tax=Arthrobacter sp. efr-133-TYG-118 TaxID=3040279 RepID=UPI00254BBDF4|nr:hypothetical protein [Arthrobacter sp. efr-133-TYG-118]
MLSYEDIILLGEERVLVIQEHNDASCWCGQIWLEPEPAGNFATFHSAGDAGWFEVATPLLRSALARTLVSSDNQLPGRLPSESAAVYGASVQHLREATQKAAGCSAIIDA